MNAEQQLRRAAEDVHRATTSLTPPPVGEVKRSARFRAAGVAVAAAVGVAVLVGGVVLAFNPRGETTLVPAGPTETTQAPIVVDGIPLVIPDLDDPPQFDLGPNAHEHTWQPPGATAAADVNRDMLDGWLADVDAVVFLGANGEYRAYEFSGLVADGTPGFEAGVQASCLVSYGPTGAGDLSCGETDSGLTLQASVTATAGDIAVFGVTGRAPTGSSVVVLEVDGDQMWRRTRDGYVFLAQDGRADSIARYVVYNPEGNVLEAKTFHPIQQETVEQPAVTVAPAVEDDGSCSARGHYSDQVLEADVPEPVWQTLAKILLFADRCWFEELAAVAAENFTVSFGGDDAAELWALQEEQGSEPMAALLQILDMPYGTSEVEGRVLYIWPAAAAHDGDWETVPQEDKDALLSLYTAEDLAAFSGWGGYIGYRLGIFDDGDWSFFVEGD